MRYMRHKKEIDHGSGYDWGQVSEEYAKYRDIYPPLFYQKITEMGLCLKGQAVLDLGTGTGVLPRNLYQYGAKFTGVDVSENQIAQARRLSQEAGMEIRYLVSSAEDIHFPEQSFDVVTACQCLMYFDLSVLVPKIHAILKDGGHFCVLFMAWLPEESAIAKKSEDLVLKYNPLWTGAGVRRAQPTVPQWADGYFEPENVLAYDVSLPFTRESWRGRIKACRGVGASSMSGEEITRFEAEHLAFLKTVPESFEIPHYVTVLNLRKRSAR